jgi:rsbT co-antagonist protein RsbR
MAQDQDSAAEHAAPGRRDDALAPPGAALDELQTPVLQVWEGVLALPIVGGLDTARAQDMTEALLERVVQTDSEIVLLDITGVPVVDTAVAKHLLETVSAARLLGAEVLIVGLTTRTALTLVHLGVDLAGVTTRTTLAKGLELAFARLGLRVVREGPPSRAPLGAEAPPEGWTPGPAAPGAGGR